MNNIIFQCHVYYARSSHFIYLDIIFLTDYFVVFFSFQFMHIYFMVCLKWMMLSFPAYYLPDGLVFLILFWVYFFFVIYEIEKYLVTFNSGYALIFFSIFSFFFTKFHNFWISLLVIRVVALNNKICWKLYSQYSLNKNMHRSKVSKLTILIVLSWYMCYSK